MNGKYLTEEDLHCVRIRSTILASGKVSFLEVYGSREEVLDKLRLEFNRPYLNYAWSSGNPSEDGLTPEQRYEELKKLLG